MQKIITSTVIGALIQDEQFPDWWTSKEVPVPFFDGKKMPVSFMDLEPEADKAFISEADAALANFFALDAAYRESISHHVYENCRDFLVDVGFDEDDRELWEIEDKRDIWKYVYPGAIYITRRHHKDQDLYILVECGCRREEEHGLQLVFRQGKKLTRVSQYDGHLTDADAYDIPDEQNKLLSAF